MPTEAEARAQAVAAVVGRVKAESVPDSEMLRLGFSAHDPKLAARVANAYADAYVEMGLETRLQAVSKAATWLTGRLEGMREKVEASERKLQAFREAEGLVDMQGALDLVDKQLSGLADRVVEARTKRDDLEGLFDQIQRAKSCPVPSWRRTRHSPATRPSRPSRRPNCRPSERSPSWPNATARRTPRWWRRARISRLSGRNWAPRLVTPWPVCARNWTSPAAQAEKLEAELAATKTNAQDANRQEFTLRALKRDVESDRQLYDLFLTRFKETNLGADVESTNARIIDAAEVPDGAGRAQDPPHCRRRDALGLHLGVGLAF